jgi:hypothetical protein
VWRIEVVVVEDDEEHRYVVAEEATRTELEPVVTRLESHFGRGSDRVSIVRSSERP